MDRFLAVVARRRHGIGRALGQRLAYCAAQQNRPKKWCDAKYFACHQVNIDI
jgi:hypothetical protein